ncbi:hypothetical protein PFLA_a4266 [Pseudoalteromonas flavipulchra NCIMB 2033 = ATCC BAA-314]|nr:hypothetical protein [Pseudoalteromonas flavipulchra NCIMB 2033 = ATCC BAA-314]
MRLSKHLALNKEENLLGFIINLHVFGNSYLFYLFGDGSSAT